MIYREGDIVYGTVTNILGFGAFVEIDKEYIGLIHISEFSDNFVRDIRDYVDIGEKVKLRVLEVEEDKKRLKLSYKTINKARGIKGEVPKFTIGFKSLRDRLPVFIKEQIDLEKEGKEK